MIMDEYHDAMDYLEDNDMSFEEDFEYDPYMDMPSTEPFEHCIKPTLSSTIYTFIGPIIIANIILRLLTRFIRSQMITHLLTIGIGVALLTYHFRDSFQLMIVLMICHIIASIILILKLSTKLIYLVCSIAILMNEITLLFVPLFVHLRPHIMLLVMKLVSFHHHNNNLKQPMNNTFYSAITYLLHPVSSILGVWHPISTASHDDTNMLHRLLKTFFYLLISIIFMLLSTCIIHLYIQETLINVLFDYISYFIPPPLVTLIELLLQTYLIALQFRFSHYFICYSSQAMFHLWDIRMTVTNPLSIEFPRSLVDVVVAWNIPMHRWLKPYVFNHFNQSFSAFKAILLTYFASSFIHGFNFQIWSVLLSLGVLTKLEYSLRAKLSHIYNACIQARSCEYIRRGTQWECASNKRHTNTPYNCLWVKLINLLFSLLSILHLAYLGSTFDGKEESSYFANVVHVWSQLGFYSHIIAIIMFIFYLII